MEIFFSNTRTEKFFESIENSMRVQARDGFNLLSRYAYNLKMPLSRPIGNGLFELRIIGSRHIRFIYIFRQGSIYMLHGFFKKSNKILKKDINYAKKQAKLLQ